MSSSKDNKKKKKDELQTVPYSKLYCLASGKDKTYMAIGFLSAAVTGVGLPSFVILMGETLDSFGDQDEQSMYDTVARMSLILVIIGVAIWITSYLYYAFLLMFSESVTFKVKIAYLNAILHQDISWFDTINPSELSSRINKETLAI